MTITETPTAWGELTNTCTCLIADEETHEFVESPECFGDCYETDLGFFENSIQYFLAESDTFRVSGIRLWNREVGGVFRANNVRDFVQGITVNSAWTLRYQVFGTERIEFSLSHHDAPTGSTSVVVPVIDPEDSDY